MAAMNFEKCLRISCVLYVIACGAIVSTNQNSSAETATVLKQCGTTLGTENTRVFQRCYEGACVKKWFGHFVVPVIATSCNEYARSPGESSSCDERRYCPEGTYPYDPTD